MADAIYLRLLWDLVTSKKPKLIVTLGFGDGQAFFTFCQIARSRLLHRLDAKRGVDSPRVGQLGIRREHSEASPISGGDRLP